MDTMEELDPATIETLDESGGVAVESRPDSRALSQDSYRDHYRSPQEVVLETGEQESSKNLGGGANETRLVKIKGDGSGVFKPKTGESDLGSKWAPRGTLYRRERAAYLVSRFLQFNFVPETTIREIDGEIGSMQRFVDNATTEYEREEPLDAAASKRFNEGHIKMKVFDYIIWNTDRHGGNYLVDDQGNIAAIDHGFSFNSIPKDFRSIYEPIPDEVRKNIISFISSEQLRQILKDLLSELLSEWEVTTCLDRIDHLASLLAEENPDQEKFRNLKINPKDR